MDQPLNIEKTLTTTKRFLSGKLMRAAAEGYVVGLSGGVDSSLSTTLAVEAVGREKVLGLIMPYRISSPESVEHARLLAEHLRIGTREVDISPMIDAYYDKIDERNRVRAGNMMARQRMAVLFDVSHETGALVLGTGNRSEISLGYTTWYGDAACSLNPIGELYKTEVRELARHLGVPEPILVKAPSADLWANQTDEGEIGVTYDTVDGILRLVVDKGIISISELEKHGFAATDISRVVSMMNRNAFKRRLPDVAPLDKPPIPDDIVLVE
jgi:NAD+ synthase